jgi:intracellular septation protein
MIGDPPPAAKRAPAWLTPTIDYGPLAVFFTVYLAFDLFAATAAIIAATILVLGLSLFFTGRVPRTALVTAAILIVFGALTLALDDERYLKLQSTLISGLFSLILFVSLVLRRPVLQSVFGAALKMTAAGWRILTLRFALFFAAMAALNELIARTLSTAVWVQFYTFGTTGLTLAFLAAQWPLLNRHMLPDKRSEETGESRD